MNLHTQPNITYAIQQHWISYAPAAPLTKPRLPRNIYRQRNLAAGLTSEGAVRQKRRHIPPEIIAAAQRDGVGVTAIYNRIKRKGRLTK